MNRHGPAVESMIRPVVASAWAGRTPLGVSWSEDASLFAVYAEAERVSVRLVHPGDLRVVQHDLTPVDGEPETWSAMIEGDWHGWTYAYEIERDGQTIGQIMDPRATLIHRGRSYVCVDQTAVTARPPLDPRDAVIYELHIRDYTRDPDGGARPSWRGKYLGLSQTGTRLAGMEIPTGLDHLRELGVTVIQFMPVHSFARPYDRDYEWGYMPHDFFAPHPGYASHVDPDAPVREFRRLVSAMHEQGFRVTLDVVFNHTAERWPDRLRNMMALAPRAYYRFKDDGEPWNGSACGNEFRSESDAGRRLIVESCLHWVRDFGVDGFRFDLMGLIDRETMEMVARELHEVDPSILVYGEPWAAGPTPIQVNDKGAQRSRGWSVFNDILRDGLRGSVFETDDVGFLVSGTRIPRVKDGLRGAIDSFADGPLECVNYIECHDNHTLADRLTLTTQERARLDETQRESMHRLGLMVLMCCPGIPFIHAGQEFDRSKDGEDNTYNLGDVINNIRWRRKDTRHRLFDFYRRMIRLRLEHPLFRPRDRETIESAVRFFDDHLDLSMPEGVLGARIEDVNGEDSWSAVVAIFNGGDVKADIPLPPGAWRYVVDGCHFVSTERTVRGTCHVPAHSGSLLRLEA